MTLWMTLIISPVKTSKFSILNKAENCASRILPEKAAFMFEKKVVKIKNECLLLKLFSLFLLPESVLSEGQYQPRSLLASKLRHHLIALPQNITSRQDLYWVSQKLHLSFSLHLIEKFERTVWPIQ